MSVRVGGEEAYYKLVTENGKKERENKVILRGNNISVKREVKEQKEERRETRGKGQGGR